MDDERSSLFVSNASSGTGMRVTRLSLDRVRYMAGMLKRFGLLCPRRRFDSSRRAAPRTDRQLMSTNRKVPSNGQMYLMERVVCGGQGGREAAKETYNEWRGYERAATCAAEFLPLWASGACEGTSKHHAMTHAPTWSWWLRRRGGAAGPQLPQIVDHDSLLHPPREVAPAEKDPS